MSYTVKEENHAGQILCKSKHTPIHIVQILIVQLIHCYVIIVLFLGTRIPKSSSLPNNSVFSFQLYNVNCILC